MKILQVLIFICLSLSIPAPVSIAQQSNSLASSIKGRFIFSRPIIWSGSQAPDHSGCADLARTLDLFTSDPRAGIDAVEQFIASNPDSPWTPSLHANLAEYNRNRGRYTLALSHWEAAWNAAKDRTDANSREIAGRSIGLWCRLLGSLGRKEDLQKLFSEAGQRGFDTSAYGSLLLGGQQATAMMKTRPGLTFRCGSFALAQASKALAPTNEAWKKLQQMPSPDGGFKLSELAHLSEQHGLNFVPVHRDAGAELVVPSVIHWQLNHYAAIVSQEKDGRYKVIDPTFGSGLIMDADTINAEASGNFLVPGDQKPQGWRALTTNEASQIHGKGFPDIISDAEDDPCATDDDPNSDDGSSLPQADDGDPIGSGSANQGCDPCQTNGMAMWRVSEPYISLWMTDVPLAFKNSAGNWTRLIMSYKQTGDTADDRYFGFGSRWSCNWLESLVESTNSTATTRKVGGGGERAYALHQAQEQEGEIMDTLMGGGKMTMNRKAASRRYETFVILTAEQRTNYFISDRVDSFGRATMHFDYDLTNNPIRLLRITDFDRKQITLNYTNTAHSNLITSITDPYGRTVQFLYSSDGTLTNITDPLGMASGFSYDSTGFITNLHTPYGDTSFKYFTSTNPIGGGDPLETGTNGSVLNRAIEVTEPNLAKQLYAFRDDGNDTNNAPVSGTYNTPDGNFMHRNSYHWDRQQYQELSAAAKANYLDMPAADYWKASLKHWLHRSYDDVNNVLTLSGILGAKAGPVVDPSTGQRVGSVSYGYYGQTDPAFAGTIGWVTSISQPLNDLYGYGYELTTSIDRNDKGRPTVITYSFMGTLTASYTNDYDLDGRRLIKQWGPRGEIVAGYNYLGPTNYFISGVTNALTNVTSYTYDTNAMHLTVTVFAGGLITTNIFYTSGSFSNFLQSKIDLGFRTNGFGYFAGNIAVQTNELGLVTSNSWDNLNRLVQVSFPDGSAISNRFSNLDLVGVKDRMNYWTSFGYNNVRQLIAITNANSAVTQIEYCDCGAPSKVTQWLGSRSLNTLTFHDIAGRATNIVYADGYSVTNEFYLEGTLHKATDSSGRQLSFTFGMYRLLTDSFLGTQPVLHRELDEYGRAFQTIDRNGVMATNSFDAVGRVLERRLIGSDGATMAGLEKFQYNARGLTNYSDPLGKTNYFTRNTLGLIIAETNANNEGLQFTYNPAREILILTNGSGAATRWNYDVFGRVTNKVDATGSNMFSYQYDVDNRLTNRWQAGNITTTFRFDPVGNLTNIVYPTSPSITLRFDGLNRLTNIVDGIGSSVFTWTDGNQLASENGPWPNDTVNYDYSARRRSSFSLAEPNASPWLQTYAYDEFSRLTNTASPAGAFAFQYADTLRGATLLLAHSDLPGGSYIEKIYDTLGRLTSTALHKYYGDVLRAHSYEYNNGHKRTRQTLNPGTYESSFMDYTYDDIGQLKTAKGTDAVTTAPRAHEQFGYAYDAVWNLVRRTNNALVQTFNVNNLNELSTSSRTGTLTVAGSAGERLAPSQYEYGVSNVTVAANGNLPAAATIYLDGSFVMDNVTALNGSNTFTAVGRDWSGRVDTKTETTFLPSGLNFTYDARGNLTSDGRRYFSYDDENELISVTVSNTFRSEFQYDGKMRRRVRKDLGWSGSTTNWIQTNEIRYVYDGMLVVQERDANNSPYVSYVRGNDLSGSRQGAGGIGGLLARVDHTGSASKRSADHAFYFGDGAGNITMMVNEFGSILGRYVYDPFGRTTARFGELADANTYRFASKQYDEGPNLYNFTLRSYDPELQRWISRDSIDDKGLLSLLSERAFNFSNMKHAKRASVNPFNFIHNRAMSSVDSWGLCDDLIFHDPFNPDDPDACDKLEKRMDDMRPKISDADNPLQGFYAGLMDFLQMLWNEYCDDDNGGEGEPVTEPVPVVPYVAPSLVYQNEFKTWNPGDPVTLDSWIIIGGAYGVLPLVMGGGILGIEEGAPVEVAVGIALALRLVIP